MFVPGGSYQPLSSDSPLRLDPFYLDRTEVTQKDYEAVMGDNPSYFKGPDRPVEKVTWFDAREYCRRVDKRLPTEWEWEKAIRAGRDTRYFWGEAMDDAYAWYKGNADKQTHPVGRKKPNPFGLYDMAGNVWEWTASFHAAGGKIVRGGSWRNSEVSLTSGKRIPSLPIHKFHYVGFRCARSAAGAD
ncbi:MAG: SUMF1/EgtB/PvdO family nonheme iron enzyme [Nitrospinaceae bacterium]|nr:formylglycine-generating enzyme family protein [Nitrospinaceae bacterium]NIT80715.1 formylglycine-generating enzyme family protein [Nitrospinaceae bacterium]NIU95109.1 SUMF1/EgtB/PvdO family nonheme iron enzyme [Nitrospinaceae bacterium]NIY13741.1 SUMF1/EgtB/PvdO family nonheme iron enzyme [Nitrospinaceae bacterium]